MFECFEVTNNRFVGFSCQPKQDKFYRVEGTIDPLEIDKTKLIDADKMSTPELLEATDKTDFINQGSSYFMIHSDRHFQSCSYVQCKPQYMLNSNGDFKVTSVFDVYFHAGENKYWAVTSFQNSTYVMFKNDITNQKWVFMTVNGLKQDLIQSKESNGYKLFGFGHFDSNKYDFDM